MYSAVLCHEDGINFAFAQAKFNASLRHRKRSANAEGADEQHCRVDAALMVSNDRDV